MAAPGRMAKAQTTRIGGSTMRDASHPRGSAGAGFAGGTELLAGT
jgi:hypothetical protein